ncbi:MAG: chromosome segregation protein SMC [Promethearchaeota archaeon]
MVYIKNIIMTGFKSYGSATVNLAFPKGFSGIIGPNGSGKSNVVDAVSFVLGELSTKSLRAKELADLIYSGTRPGDKAAEKAIVNILFDNSDHRIPVPLDEVSVQREIKSGGGGSVYRFNGKRSTRTEIMDKLKIANIDVKEGFNLVLQGRIAELAGMHPDARREMIEELAGTREFDLKKLSALEELDKSENKLSELDLLIREFKNRLKSLAKEKESYEEWERVSEEIYDKQTLILSSKHRNLIAEMKENQIHIEEITKEIENLNQIKTEKKSIVDEVVQKIQEKKREIQLKFHDAENNQSNFANFKASVTGINRDIKNKKKRITELQQEKIESQKKIQEIEELIEKTKEEIVEIEESINKLTRQKEEKSINQQNLNQKIAQRDTEYKELQERYEDFQAQINKAEKLLNNNEIQVQMKESSIQIKRANYLSKSKDLDLRKKENKQLNEQLVDLESELEQYNKLLEIAEKQIESSAKKRQSYEDSIEDLARKKMEIQHKTSSISSKIETIQSFFTEDQESNPVLMNLMEKAQKKEIKGVVGVLKDLLPMDQMDLKEKVALTPFMNSIVVDDAMTAIACINYLRDSGVGSASFIPLEQLNQITKDQKNEFAFIDKIDKKIRSISSIFQNTQIADNLREAIDLWMLNIRKKSYTINVITPYGDTISRDGVISGGANANFAEKLIPELKEKLIEDKETLEKVNAELEVHNMKYKRLVVLVNEIKRKQDNVYEKNKIRQKQIEEIQRTISSNLVFIEKVEKEIESINQEIEAADLLISNLKQERKQLYKRLQESETERDELKAEIEKSEIKDLFQKVRKIENEIAQMDGEIRAKKATKNEKEHQNNVILSRNLSDNKHKFQSIKSALVQIENDIKQLQEKHSEEEAHLNQLKEIDTKLKSEINQLQDEVDSQQASITNIQKEIASIERKIERFKQQISDTKIKNEGAKTRLSNIQKSIEELEIDLIDVKEEVDESTLELEIRALSNKKRTLEPINALSVRQYQEAKMRFDELNSRREELDQERKVIVDFINKIEFEKKTIFLRLFSRINKEFGIIFSMIAGGKAEMKLENPENPFEGGINIIAKPGGKTVKSIQAMSGGEKSLTSLALIFSMQKVDPSPFYIFDEIDAALDVMNVRKVAKLIEQISKESQCIMITHRDIAMRYTNQLYGVTNLKGVSKVISVALTDEGTLKALSS